MTLWLNEEISDPRFPSANPYSPSQLEINVDVGGLLSIVITPWKINAWKPENSSV